jgi:glutamate N-acetyltransferase/amino-acid N-acetyltransferase
MSMTAISTPKGYRFATAYAGFRSPAWGARDDVALAVSDTPAVVAAMFTRNLFPAAPVIIGRELIRTRREARAVLVNAGIANACTGDQGLANCRLTQGLAASLAGIAPAEVLPASTGVIGVQFAMDKWERVLPLLGSDLGRADPLRFSQAMTTTDAFPKTAGRLLDLAGGRVTLAGMAKGAGMICPDMATMICIVLCDAIVAPALWTGLIRRAVDTTLNRATVDGDTSTNDTVYALANGASGVRAETGDDQRLLRDALADTFGRLAYMLVQDGEGASKVLHIAVTGAASDRDAERAARAVGHSQLVKTAMYGKDPNWGRIIAALGYCGARFRPEAVSVSLCGVELFRNGRPADVDVDAVLTGPLQHRDVSIDISLGGGPGAYALLASDLGHEYVDCNASYRS